MGRGESIDLVEEDLAPLKRKRDDEEEEEANSGWKQWWKQQILHRANKCVLLGWIWIWIGVAVGNSWKISEESKQQQLALCETSWQKACHPLSTLEYHRSKKPNARRSEFVSPCQSTCEWVPWQDGMCTILGPRRWTDEPTNYINHRVFEVFKARNRDGEDGWVNSRPLGLFIPKVKCYWDTWQNRAVLVKLWQKVVSSHGDPPKGTCVSLQFTVNLCKP